MPSRICDKHGNEVWCQEGRVYLRLAGSTRTRCLGIIDGEKFCTRRKTGKHVMRTLSDIGFNHALIRSGKFSLVEVELSDGRILRTTRDHILERGVCRNFASEGQELQIFLPITEFQRNNEQLMLEGITP